ncbi:MAG: DNA-directed RNA polymerase subunit omega [Microscillaceae bacterium]
MHPKHRAPKSSLSTRDIAKMVEPTDNLYKSVSIISRRAEQIAVLVKEELNIKLADFASSVDSLEEMHENREQIEISKYYERLPKPTIVATEEFLNGKLRFRNRTEDDKND